LRVRGAILDELRRNSVFPQQVLERIAMIRRARRELPAPASLADLATATGLTEDEVADTLLAMRLARMASWEEESSRGMAHPTTAQTDANESREQIRLLAEAIESLPERERIVVTLYFRDELRLKEIAAALGLSVSRISRLLSAALLELREWLRARGQDANLPLRDE
jgi:RNA polymerase sigma factor for flagellar operon FliA